MTSRRPARRMERVVCRVCGEWGYEDADDPCPGLCPACLERALLRTMFATWGDRHDRGLSVGACLRLHDERLESIGMTPSARDDWQRKARRILADELAAERRAN